MVTSSPPTSAPGTDKTGMDFRRILPEIRCQSCLSPGSEPTPRGRFSPRFPPALIDRLRHQLDVLLARRFALGVLLDPGLPASSVRHVAASAGKLGDIGVLDRDLLSGGLGQDAHRRSCQAGFLLAIEDVALQAFAGIERNGNVAAVVERLE